MAKTLAAGLALSALGATVALAVLQRLPPFKLALVDRAGVVTHLGSPPPGVFAPRISPDGRKVAFDTGDGRIWLADLTNIGAAKKFVSGRFPTWAADGRRLLFAGPDSTRLFWQSSDGTGSPELINDSARGPETWSANPDLVTYVTRRDADDYDIWAFSPGERIMRPFVDAPGIAEMNGRFSPDGEWFAYQSNDSGAFEVYVEPYPRTGMRIRVTTGGGECPMWLPGGREIVYDRDHALYERTMSTMPRVEAGPEIALPVKGFMQLTGRRRQWDITPDGKQFLVVLP